LGANGEYSSEELYEMWVIGPKFYNKGDLSANMDLDKVLNWIKLSPKYLLGIEIISGFLLFGNSALLETLGLKEFQGQYRSWIGLSLVISSGLLGAHILVEIWTKGKNKVSTKRVVRAGKTRLKNLTQQEKKILNGFISNQTRTWSLDFTDGVVSGLESYKIIYRAGNMSNGGTYFSYNIQPWAWEYLNKHPELLGQIEAGDKVQGVNHRRHF